VNFDLNEEQTAMEDMAKKFAEKEIVPHLKEEKFNRDLIRHMGQLGLFGCAFPESMGGSGAGFLVEADLVAHRAARCLAQFLGDAAGNGEGGDAPRLGAADHA